MSEITLDATQATQVNLKLADPDGNTVEYHGEVMPLTKPRLDAVMALRKKMQPLTEKAAKGKATEADEHAAAALLAEIIDTQIRSTNGPVTMAGLWEDGVVDFGTMRKLMARLNEETGNPPA